MHLSRDLVEAWQQDEVPVVCRLGKGCPVYVKLKDHDAAYDNLKSVYWYMTNWLRAGNKHPVWLQEFACWSVPAAWFSKIIRRCLARYGSVYVLQPYREQEKCAPACWDAQGDICECSCLGENHGSGQPDGYYVVSETFAVRWSGPALGCKLLVAKWKM